MGETIQTVPMSYFERLKAAALTIEAEAMAEAHKAEQDALAAAHALITTPRELLDRIMGKL